MSRFTARRHRLPARMLPARWERSSRRLCCCANRLDSIWRRSGLKGRSIAFSITAIAPLISPKRARVCCAARSSSNTFAPNCMMRWFIRSATDGAYKATQLLGFSEDQAACDHVVQRLLLFRESRHDVADTEWNHSSDDLGEKSSAGARERDWPTLRIGNDKPQRHFAERPLMWGTLHPCVVDPGDYNREGRCQKNQRYEGHWNCGVFAIHVFEDCSEIADSHNCHHQQGENSEDDSCQNAVNYIREKPKPKSCVR